MNKSLISIIMPNFNSQEYIEKTIESVLNQTYKNWELIIVDDCSTDSSCNVIKRYMEKDDRIKLYRLEKNSGYPAIPRNYGIKKSNGEYIAFLDSDDIWHYQKLELQIYYMLKNNILFSATEIKIFREISTIKKYQNKHIDYSLLDAKKINHSKLIYKNIIPNSSVIVKKNIINRFQFKKDSRYKAIEDYAMWLILLQNGNICYKLNQQLLFYRLAESSISKSKFSMFKKHYMLYNEYKYKGKRIGLKKFLYLSSYIYFSVINKIIKRKV